MKTKINSKEFPGKMGAYSHAYAIDLGTSQMIFTTGQLAIDPSGAVVAPGDVAAQAEFIYTTINSILGEAGASLDDVVKTTVFLTDIADFAKFSPVRNQYFKNAEPASTLVAVSKLIKEGCVIEIEVVAIKEK